MKMNAKDSKDRIHNLAKHQKILDREWIEDLVLYLKFKIWKKKN